MELKTIYIIDTRLLYSEIKVTNDIFNIVNKEIGMTLNCTRKENFYDGVVLLDSDNFYKFKKIIGHAITIQW